MAKDQRQLVRQDRLERAIADLCVQLVDTGGADLHQNLTPAKLRLWHFGKAKRCLPLVFVKEEGFHG